MSWNDNVDSYFSDESATFGDRLAAARSAAGMDQKSLARKLGVKLAVIERWENDLSEPRANRLPTLTGLLNVSLPWLLMGHGDGIDDSETEPLPDDVNAMLLELRDLRTALITVSDRMAVLEKRLRARAKEVM